jgi:hypothetical protein
MNATPNTPAVQNTLPEAIEKALMMGDLSSLTPEQRVVYHKHLCDTVGLNPFTRPFDYLKTRDGKLVPYANKGCTEQLRAGRRISLEIVSRDKIGQVYVVTARAISPDGRRDESTGAVDLEHLKGEALANALMKAETKAKRRVTLSICGLNMLDECEVLDNPKVFTRVFEEQATPKPSPLPDLQKELPAPQANAAGLPAAVAEDKPAWMQLPPEPEVYRYDVTGQPAKYAKRLKDLGAKEVEGKPGVYETQSEIQALAPCRVSDSDKEAA